MALAPSHRDDRWSPLTRRGPPENTGATGCCPREPSSHRSAVRNRGFQLQLHIATTARTELTEPQPASAGDEPCSKRTTQSGKLSGKRGCRLLIMRQAGSCTRPGLLVLGWSPRWNRTGDSILTMEPPGTAVRTGVVPGHARPSGPQLSALSTHNYGLSSWPVPTTGSEGEPLTRRPAFHTPTMWAGSARMVMSASGSPSRMMRSAS